jgi:ATP-dependent Lhr-like helicase
MSTQPNTLEKGIRCIYISPLRSLNYDVEQNLTLPLKGICRELSREPYLVEVGVRTADTLAYERRALRNQPPHILITTSESLSLLLS